jgi:hypothetical protein
MCWCDVWVEIHRENLSSFWCLYGAVREQWILLCYPFAFLSLMWKTATSVKSMNIRNHVLLLFPFRALWLVCYNVTNKYTHFTRIAILFITQSPLTWAPWKHSDLQAAPSAVPISIFITTVWRICDDSTHRGGQAGWTIILYNCALHDNGLLKTKTRRRLRIKILSYFYLSVRIFGHIVTYSVSRNSSARQHRFWF